MKKLLFILLLSTGFNVQAQQQSASANPSKGFWVIESNVKLPRKQVVKFYNVDEQLLYQEDYNRKVLKCSSKRTRFMLDSILTFVLNRNNVNESAPLAKLIKYNH